MLAHTFFLSERPSGRMSAYAAPDALALISLGIDTVEIRSRATPPMRISLSGGGNSEGPADPTMEALLKRVQPAVIFSGRLGRFQVAPYGVPSGIDPLFSTEAGVVAGAGLGLAALMLVGLGYFLGR